MARSRMRRRLATVLFLDIVGSTALASELGDARWRELLTRFQRLVRAELKRFGGHEQDAVGDGFLATFAEPAQALHAAGAIVAGVQQLGIDVRAGAHTGECEQIDRKLGGIAVHIGSRIMALAGPAEVLTTGTVRDLVAGSGAGFEDRGIRELRGVDGSWHVLSLRSLESVLPPPLSAEESATRLALIPAPTVGRGLRLALAGGALVVAAAVAIPLFALSRETKAAGPISLVRLDGRTTHVLGITREAAVSRGLWANLWSVDGTLWQLAGNQQPRLLERNMRSGRVVHTLELPGVACSCRIAFGFGSVWLLADRILKGTLQASVSRIDAVSGRIVKTLGLPGTAEDGTIATGNGAVWVLEHGGALMRIDPITNRVSRTYQTRALETTSLVPLSGYDWICECAINSLLRFDPRTRASKTFSIPAQAYLVGVDTSRGRTLWLLDPQNATLTSLDPATGRTESPLGLSGEPQQAVIAFGAVWAAAGHVVDRFDLRTRERSAIEMPKGVWAGSIAADTRSGSIWVGNSVVAP